MPYNKAQYIEKFGEDYYYNVVVPRQREASKKYRNSEKGKEVRHSYNLSEKGRASFQKYADSEKGKASKKNKQIKYLSTKEGKAVALENRYIAMDRSRNFDTSNNIDHKWILEKILSSSCYYCGENDWNLLGCDRINNTLPHTPENCLCSCMHCNARRANRWTVEEFKEKIEKEKTQEKVA